MPTKMLPPNTTIWWIDQAALTTPSAPKVSELTTALASVVVGSAALNLSAALATGYTLNPTGSDTDASRSIVDSGTGESRGAGNYNGLLPFFMEKNPLVNTTSDYLAAYKMFKTKGRAGYIIRRLGKLYTSALIATDLVEVYQFLSAMPRFTEGNSGGPVKFVVPLLKQGFLVTNVAAVA